MQAVRQLNEEVVKLEAEVLRYLKNCRVLAPPRTVCAECLSQGGGRLPGVGAQRVRDMGGRPLRDRLSDCLVPQTSWLSRLPQKAETAVSHPAETDDPSWARPEAADL